MTRETSRPTNTVAWKLRHSAWLLAVVLGVGSFSFIGFVYCAARVGTRRWWVRAGITTALSLFSLVFLLASNGESTWAGGYAALLWIGLMAYGVVVNHDYLRWRALRAAASNLSSNRPTSPEPPHAHQTPLTVPDARPAHPGTPADHYGEASTEASKTNTEPSNGEDPVGVPHDAEMHLAARPEALSLEEIEVAPGSVQIDTKLSEPGVAVSTWQDAEALAAWHMRKLGFGDAELTPAGADGGIDVRASNAVAQVKHYATPVGGPAVQQLLGAAHGHDVALFYALSGYTKAALDFAESTNVALFQFNQDGQVLPVSGSAHLLQDRAGSVDGFDASEFEIQMEARRISQRLFDFVTQEFFDTGRRALEAAQGDPRSPLVQSLKVEMRRVEAIIKHLGEDTVPLPQFMDEVDQVRSATSRLEQDLR